ncbi:hypothetical protein EGR_05143 [Echinococcus granulosus]|uniref:Uncharacterized protein n=1 Tax=Echinococcus granulosus TaxID=6210 RepID=W6UNV2_ECHGR|nr:hypothetical protein EGR_05143 [Echinococcus granulosus]EUB59982.1 hypothetical protein EGR_05143 [Echinococcus granulosus]
MAKTQSGPSSKPRVKRPTYYTNSPNLVLSMDTSKQLPSLPFVNFAGLLCTFRIKIIKYSRLVTISRFNMPYKYSPVAHYTRVWKFGFLITDCGLDSTHLDISAVKIVRFLFFHLITCGFNFLSNKKVKMISGLNNFAVYLCNNCLTFSIFAASLTIKFFAQGITTRSHHSSVLAIILQSGYNFCTIFFNFDA